MPTQVWLFAGTFQAHKACMAIFHGKAQNPLQQRNQPSNAVVLGQDTLMETLGTAIRL